MPRLLVPGWVLTPVERAVGVTLDGEKAELRGGG